MTVILGSVDRATPSPTPSLIERHPRDQTYTPVNLPPLPIYDEAESANAVVFEKRSSRRLRTMSLASFKSVPSLRAESRMSGGAGPSLPGSNATSPVNTTFPPLGVTKSDRVKEKDAHKIPLKPRADDSFPASQIIARPISGTLASPYPSFIGSARNPFEDYIETFACPPDAVYDAFPGGRAAHGDLLAPAALHDWSDELEIRAAATRPRPRCRSSTISLMSMASTPDLTLPVRKHRPSPLGLTSSSSTLDLDREAASLTVTKKKSNGGLKRVLKATRKSFTDLRALASRQPENSNEASASVFDVKTIVPAVPPIPIAYWKQPNSIYSESTSSFANVPTPRSSVTSVPCPDSPTSPKPAYSQLRPAVSARSSCNSAYTAFTVSSSEGVRTPSSVDVSAQGNNAEFTGGKLVDALEDAQVEMQQQRTSTSSLDLPSLVGSPSSSHSTALPTPALQSQMRNSEIVVVRAPPPPRARPRGRSFTAPQLNWSAPLAGAHYTTGHPTKTNGVGRARTHFEPAPIVLPTRAYRDQPRPLRVVNH